MDIKNSKRPFIIAGPCSAENEQQVLETAKQISLYGIKVFRAGIWKPRTRPGNFEGVGSKGLNWLKKVKSETGMQVTTEVANTKHVYEALKAGIDILWIGARTSANPFAVQEIADSVAGMNIPVMIKNPINADIDLWVGAIERFQKAGITNITAIHRGFSSFTASKYRNEPMWQIPIELRRRMKELPIICDPSHISGKRNLLQSVSQKAMDLNYEGLMIETHINPDIALSDAKQQITPNDLKRLIDNLIIRHRKPGDSDFPEYEETLEELRTKIDEYDNIIFGYIHKRMEVAKDIGSVKKKSKITILQPERWNQIVKNAVKKGEELGLSNKFVTAFLNSVHQESINQQTNIFNKTDEG
ncbi:MAG: bifunctional 3-deoxy-7-phosphoheptulonate synthase/chorismate mutase type II [Chlorobi bacterium]|nr:bifunctional 3-deoxy-7-phosphoheptulonate synthase/chorismate mutase type II [Chlorobiota bacterium]